MQSIESTEQVFHVYSTFSGLEPNFTKSEVADLGVLRDFKVAVCGIQSININTKTIRMLGINFSYYENLKEDKNKLNVTLCT